jgi:hypothetical protein
MQIFTGSAPRREISAATPVCQRIVERSRPEFPETLMHDEQADQIITGWGSGQTRLVVRSSTSRHPFCGDIAGQLATLSGTVGQARTPQYQRLGVILHRIDRQRTTTLCLKHPRTIGCLAHLAQRAQVIPRVCVLVLPYRATGRQPSMVPSTPTCPGSVSYLQASSRARDAGCSTWPLDTRTSRAAWVL